jgi:hypothetical protein
MKPLGYDSPNKVRKSADAIRVGSQGLITI